MHRSLSLTSFRHWAAGSVEGRGLDVVAILVPAITAGLAVAMLIAGNLNAIALGRDFGAALGVNLHVTRLLACLSVMLLAGSATAGAGPVAFVGLVAPHLAGPSPDRTIVGYCHTPHCCRPSFC